MITMTMTTSMNIAVFLVFGVFANEFFQCSAVKVRLGLLKFRFAGSRIAIDFSRLLMDSFLER